MEKGELKIGRVEIHEDAGPIFPDRLSITTDTTGDGFPSGGESIPTQESVEKLVDERIEHFFSGKCVEDGLKEEFRKEMQTVAYSLRKFFKEEIDKMSHQLKIDFMEELKNL